MIDINKLKIRDVVLNDSKKICEIYKHYVEFTSISLEITIPDVEEIKKRIENILSEKYPYIVVEDEKEGVIGYAYASKFNEREGFKYTSSISIYLDPCTHSKGIGQKLYDELEKRLKKMKIVQIVSVINGENEKSIKFHQKNDFIKIGCFTDAAYKLEKWHDILWMVKKINSLEII
ncbi:MAG: N-acetyltransferase [Leptotrichiaceae bacterium]|nr:N-acetyltransferase [Leptotrichiaceae bacterium]MBP6281867.1 N-acetyltransferase [Leptotrichiaceae bacterium]MBP7101159.1 N-acetyltransferase [Leptotrichiaceae bacterium]MBP9630266.1 N-acetyltransferase [Leptotrichiaceae bacterium]